MEVKLSQTEVAEIAAEVVRLMKQEGLVSTIPHIASEPGDEVANNTAEPAAKPTDNTNRHVPATSDRKGKSTASVRAEAAPKRSRKESAKQSTTATPPSASTPPSSTVSATGDNATYTIDAAAEVKGYHPNTIRRAIKSGKLKGKIGKGGKYQIKASDLDKFSI